MTAVAPRPPAANRSVWPRALLLCLVQIALLNWLLARVIWLPFYFGIFFFLVAGLLVSGWAFRVARPARPIRTVRILVGVLLVTLGALATGVYWEYRAVAATIGAPPRFADARQAAAHAGAPAPSVDSAVSDAFRAMLRRDYPPGGAIGYARWAAAAGDATLTLPNGFADRVRLPHRGWRWLARTCAAYALFAVGAWFQLESLRSPTPVTNLLAPGEEAIDEEA
ncbi:MAG: hypothetical protein U1A27_05290 [Phycisphaerae bacterium]